MVSKSIIDAEYNALAADVNKVNKYKHPGIYAIKINNIIVYVGKSTNMLKRIAEHISEIKHGTHLPHKYIILQQALSSNLPIGFDVICYSKRTYKDSNELGNKEAYYINKLKPPLNIQYPIYNNWHNYTINEKARTITLSEILQTQDSNG